MMIKVQILEEWEVIHRYPYQMMKKFIRYQRRYFKPAINGMIKNGNPFKGFLYAGLLIEEQTENYMFSNLMQEWEILNVNH